MKLFAKKIEAAAQVSNEPQTEVQELSAKEVDTVSGGRMVPGPTDTGTSCDWGDIWVY